jgi:hypothetical protein
MPYGEFHDQGVAKWIVIRLLWGHKRYARGYLVVSDTININIVSLISELTFEDSTKVPGANGMLKHDLSSIQLEQTLGDISISLWGCALRVSRVTNQWRWQVVRRFVPNVLQTQIRFM